MIIKDINNNYSLNLLLNCIKKKGKNNIAKKLILNSSINIFKNDYYSFFSVLIENLIKNSVLPFTIKKNNNKYKYIYKKQYKNISNIIINIVKKIRTNNNRISLNFYLTNEIYKLYNSSSFINFTKNNNVKLFNNLICNNSNLFINKNKFMSLNSLIKLKNILLKNWEYYNFKYKHFYLKNKYKKKFILKKNNLNYIISI